MSKVSIVLGCYTSLLLKVPSASHAGICKYLTKEGLSFKIQEANNDYKILEVKITGTTLEEFYEKIKNLKKFIDSYGI